MKQGLSFASNNCAYAIVDCGLDVFHGTCKQGCYLQQERRLTLLKRPQSFLSTFLCGMAKEVLVKALWNTKGYKVYALAAHCIMQNYTPLLEVSKQEIEAKECTQKMVAKTLLPLLILTLQKQMK